MSYLTTQTVWYSSYATLLGGGTIFLTGMYLTTIDKLETGLKSYIFLILGSLIIISLTTFIWKSGGYQKPQGNMIKIIFLFLPEIISLGMFFFLRGYLTIDNKNNKKENIISRFFIYFGKISYSGYIFSMFTLDLAQRIFFFVSPGGWASFIFFGILYFMLLTIFASISFYAIEKPF